LRYKECHGALGAFASDPAADARAALDRSELAAARTMANRLLEQSPEMPQALEVLARVAAAEGDALAALRLWLRAARAVTATSAPPAFAYSVWSELGQAFLEAARGVDADAEAARRQAYRQWSAARGPGRTGQSISVVVVLPARDADRLDATLRSVASQTRLPHEVVVVPLGSAIDVRSGTAQFPIHRLEAAASKAEALNAGVKAATGEWIVAVEPPHAFEPAHLATLVGEVERAGAAWGFSDATVAALGEVAPDRIANARATLDGVRSALAKSESAGLALIHRTFVAVGDGAIVFARTLFDAVGGFRPVGAGCEAWDFALRAALVDEPARSAAPTYVHAVHAAEPTASHGEWEAAQLTMFRSFHALAADPDRVARNPYAPTLRTFGVAFLRRLFRTGHVLMVDLATLERIAALIEARSREARVALTPGINLVGFAFAEFGLGESLRAMARSCAQARVPFVVNELEHSLATRQTDRTLERHVVNDVRHRLSLMCANPDVIEVARPWLARTHRAGGRTAGYWFWELETLPRAWLPAIDAFDELWCATGFVAGAMRKATSKPVITIPPAVEVVLAREYARSEFGLPDRRFLFLFTFDYNSFVARKNPSAVVSAFLAAFSRHREDVGLVVKSVNGVRRPDRVAEIEARIGGDPRIHHLDAFLDRDASYGLLSVADCYVSLHRSEGLGLGLAEAMLLGKPAIATAYSGNLEFMSEANSLLVDYSLVALHPGDYLYDDPAFFWAEPDVDDAARKMRRVVDDAQLRARLAAEGPAAVRRVFDRGRSAALLRGRLAELGILPA
jgi:glycosyltransferase involved in cell wall biosynthesis